MPRALACLAAGLAIPVLAGGRTVICDFDAGDLAAAWHPPQGRIVLAREPADALPGPRPPEVSGQILRAVAAEPGFFYARRGLLPDGLESRSVLTLWAACANPGAQASPAAFEVQFLEPGGKAKFWRKVELATSGWTRVEAPLRFMAWGAGLRSPDWRRVAHLGLYLRTPGEWRFDALALESDGVHTAWVGSDELRALAFPACPPEVLREAGDAQATILTDSAALDLPALGRHLLDALAAVRADLPFLPSPRPPAVLIVFDRDEDYRAFAPRYAGRLNALAEPPTSDGYTLQGVSSSARPQDASAIRPVYLHELVHSWIDRTARLSANAGDWLQEGLANHYQVRFHPQPSLAGIVRAGLADETHRMPLPDLCNGRRIPGNRYWQALTVVRMLLEHAAYRARMHKLFAAVRDSGSTDLGPHLGPVYGTDWDAFERDWTGFCRSTYAE